MKKELADVLVGEIVKIIDSLKTVAQKNPQDKTRLLVNIEKLKLLGGMIRAEEMKNSLIPEDSESGRIVSNKSNMTEVEKL